MFDTVANMMAMLTGGAGEEIPGLGLPWMLSGEALRRVRDWLLAAQLPDDPAAQVEVLAGLEELKRADVAVQASVALDLEETTRASEKARGMRSEHAGRGVPLQLALATRTSPHRARVFLGAARVWHTEMPHTLEALRAGVLDQYAATVLVRETACLPLEARQQVDRELCGDHVRLEGVGVKRLTAWAKALAARLDPAAVVARARKADGERTVTIRPAPDTMVYLTALLPVAQGVAAYAALKEAADLAVAAGSGTGDAPRSRGQVMADTLVRRLTGQQHAQDVPVSVNLVISDAALLGAGHEPAIVLDGAAAGCGVVPAQVARELVARGLDIDAAWLRQVYADPSGRLVAATSTRRFFADGLAALLRVRDQGICRTPYCDAPVRHLDHVTPHAEAGPTSLTNGQGLCEACNQAKNTAGWSQRVVEPDAHTVLTATPTGHAYRSHAPPPPQPAAGRPVADPVTQAESTVEHALAGLLAAL